MKGSALVMSLLVASAFASAARADAAPTLTAVLSGSAVLGEPVVDTITLSGGMAPTGQLSVSVYGPADPTCSGFPASSTFVPIADNGAHAFQTQPDDVGTFRYVASYSGDASNTPVSTGCGDPDQTVTVTPAHSRLATTASPGVVGGQLTDTARLSHVVSPGGTVTFSLYGPGDDGCAGPPVATSTVTPQTLGDDDTRATSHPFVATVPGTYHWIASYSGDARNLPVAGACGDPGESVTVSLPQSPVGPSLRLRTTTGGASVGKSIYATASLVTGGIPAGELTFRVFRPGDATCRRGAVAASTRDVLGDGDYASDPFTPDQAGTYRIVAVYHGSDGSTLATDCDDPAGAAEIDAAGKLRPILERSVTVAHVRGRVLVQVPGQAARRPSAVASAIGFVQLYGQRNVPVGSTVNVHAGTARITSATKRRSRFQSGIFHGASFVVQQRAAGGDRVELRLRRTGTASGRCNGDARTSRRRRLRRRIAAKLHAEVRGDFRTHGEHSSAEARSSSVSTAWVTSERCDGTLTRVTANVVKVRDFRLHETVLVHAGHSYLARGGRR